MTRHPLRIAVRSLMRAPGFAVTAILTLALGLGLSTAVFTVADAILIRRLPVGDQGRLVVLWSETREQTANWPFAIDDVREIARRRGALEQAGFVGYYGSAPETIRDGDQVYRLRRSLVSGNFFDVLQTRPVLGRGLRAEDDLAGAALVAVLSHRAWRQRFGGDPAIVGRQLLIHDTGRAYRIVGVIPQGLDYPEATDFWAPLVATSTGTADSLNLVSLHLVGRLRAGASRPDAEAELTSYLQRPEAPAWSREFRGAGQDLPSLILGHTKPAVLIFAAAAVLLLLLTCINVANLLLVRGLGRRREFAVRSALGAGRRRLVAELLLESVLLALAGGALGVGLALAAVRGFVAVAPGDIPRLDEIRLNGGAILAAIGITAAATMLFALAPAFATSRVTLPDVLRAGARQSGGGRRVRIVTEGLVAAQIALAVMVLFAAGLIGKSLLKLERVDLAFEPTRVLIGELALPVEATDGVAKQLALLDGVLARVAAVPGVEAVSPALTVPFAPTGFGIAGFLAKPGQSKAESAKNPLLNMEVIAPNYFTTLGIPVLRGRPFSAADLTGSAPVVIISESTARHYWPGADPLGQTLLFGPTDPPLTVVGVVPNTRYRELRTARASVYFPLRQSAFPVIPLTLVIRTAGPPASIVGAVRNAIAEGSVALASASPLETLLDQPRAQPRLNAILLAAFAATAVILAAVGLFGVTATMVRHRTAEFGIRMALGGTPGGMRRLVMGRGLTIAAAGTATGIGGALVTSGLLTDLLFEVGPSDLLTLGIGTALILGVAALASWLPARAAMALDPGATLRSDR